VGIAGSLNHGSLPDNVADFERPPVTIANFILSGALRRNFLRRFVEPRPRAVARVETTDRALLRHAIKLFNILRSFFHIPCSFSCHLFTALISVQF